MSKQCPRCKGLGKLPGASEARSLKQDRKRTGLSLRAVAKKLNVSHVYLCDIENHRRGVSWSKFDQLTKFLAKVASQ